MQHFPISTQHKLRLRQMRMQILELKSNYWTNQNMHLIKVIEQKDLIIDMNPR